jgi:hypothetical protein
MPRSTPIANVVALFIAGAGLVTLAFVGHYLYACMEARQWPTTRGTVIESHVVKVDVSGNRPGNSKIDRAQVKFRYEVGGNPFESDNLRFSTDQVGGVKHYYPPEVAPRFPVGTVITVAYDPTDPASAVSEIIIDNSAYAKMIAGVLMFVGGAGYLATHRLNNSASGVIDETNPQFGSADPKPALREV